MYDKDLLNHIKNLANTNFVKVLNNLGITDYSNGNGEIRMICPVHDHSDNPTAFVYNFDKQRWFCYTNNCHISNDYYNNVFGLVQAVKKIDFKNAFIWICNVLDIPVNNSRLENINHDELDLNKIVTKAKLKKKSENKNKFSYNLESFKERYQPSDYFKRIGFKDETINKYLMFDCLSNDKPMYNRACIPIINNNKIIGITGRIMLDACRFCKSIHYPNISCNEAKQNPLPKWKHYGFNSSNILFNLENARNSIIERSKVVIVEGPKNSIALDEIGIHNSIAIFGLNFDQTHLLELIKLNVKDLYFIFDLDEAGISCFEKIKENLSLLFNVYNLSGHISEYGLDIFDMRNNTTAIDKLKSILE